MQIVEYRITLPLTLQEYQVAQLYTINESLKKSSSGGAEVVVLRNEAFSNFPLLGGEKFSSGQYTLKTYKCSCAIPQFIKSFLPQESIDLHEEAWDAYPYCRTQITNSFKLKKRFYIKIESLHLENDCGTQDNVHELPEEILKQRKVVFIDIANDVVAPKDYRADQDPTTFHSIKTGRGPLKGLLWRETCQPVMTCYKLVSCEFKSFGFQNTFERLMQKFERRVLTNFHRHLFCLIDHWYDLTLNDMSAKEGKSEDENCDEIKQINIIQVLSGEAGAN